MRPLTHGKPMDRLLEYCTHHPCLAALAALAAVAALGYELWLRSQNAGALAPQDVIRLMNQGATVLDLRAAEAFAAGHINGARHFDAGADRRRRRVTQEIQRAPADRLLRPRHHGRSSRAYAGAAGFHQGIQSARRPDGLACRESAPGPQLKAA